MHDPIPSPCLVPFDGSFRVADAPTAPPADAPDKKGCKKRDRLEVCRTTRFKRNGSIRRKGHERVVKRCSTKIDSLVFKGFSSSRPLLFRPPR